MDGGEATPANTARQRFVDLHTMTTQPIMQEVDKTGTSTQPERSERSRRAYQAIVDHGLDAILLADDDARYVSANPAACWLLGYTRDELLALSVWDITPDGNEENGLTQWRHFLEARRLEGEYTVLRKDGTQVETEFRAVANILPGLHLSVLRDVTGRIRAEESLRESERRFRAVADLVPDLLWRADHTGAQTWVNQRWIEYTGQALEEAVGYGWADSIHPDDRDQTLHAYRQAVGAGEPFRREYRICEADGTYRWFLVEAVPVRGTAGSGTEWFGAGTDVHDQRTAMETLEELVVERTQQVRDLAAHLTRAEQQERGRIAQVLHDDIQQLLYGIQTKLTLVSRDADAGDLKSLQEGIAEIKQWLGTTISKTRQLTVGLSPPILKDEGLTDAIMWLQHQMEDLHGLKIDLSAEHSFYIPDDDLRILLFQIVRELLFNVKKHAGVDEATVRLTDAEGRIVIHVADEGEGFDADEVARSGARTGGLGLFSARERLQLLGGHMKVRSRPGRGTHVEVHTGVEPAHPKK